MFRNSWIVVVVACFVPGPLLAQGMGESSAGIGAALLHEDAAEADLMDPVAELMLRLEAGETELPRDPDWGYLPAVLEALDIPLSSQSLVFSRTSLQVDMIAPWAPRAIYFNDDV